MIKLALLAAALLTGGDLTRQSFEVDEYKILPIQVITKLPPKHQVISSPRISRPDELDIVKDSEDPFRIYVTGPPGEHQLSIEIEHAETVTLEDGRQAAVVPYHRQTFNYSILIKRDLSRPPPIDPEKPPEKPETKKAVAGAYIYESDEGPVPIHVDLATRDLNAEGKIRMEQTDKDVKTGTGEVPSQLAKSLDAAKKAGIPAIVLRDEANEVVATLAPVPKTAEEIISWVHQFTGR